MKTRIPAMSRVADLACVVRALNQNSSGRQRGQGSATITALMASIARRLESIEGRFGQRLAEINRGLMPIIRQTGQPVFATVFYGLIDTDAGTAENAVRETGLAARAHCALTA
jgi:sigma-B regulation protein RsbU (phosphoserine phosphatase)